MLVPSALLVLACLLVGILPAQTVGPLLAIAAAVDSRRAARLRARRLARIHGAAADEFRGTRVAASLFYAWLHHRRRTHDGHAAAVATSTPAASLTSSTWSLIRGAGRLTRYCSHWRLQPQLILIVVAALAAGLLPLMIGGWSAGSAPSTPLDPLFAAALVRGLRRAHWAPLARRSFTALRR